MYECNNISCSRTIWKKQCVGYENPAIKNKDMYYYILPKMGDYLSRLLTIRVYFDKLTYIT